MRKLNTLSRGTWRFSGLVGAGGSDIAAQIITGTGPTLAAMTEGDTLGSAVVWGSYASSAGTISVTREMYIGAGWVAYVAGATPLATTSVRVREWVTDSVATPERVFYSGVQVVAVLPVAPSLTGGAITQSGADLIITPPTASGSPTPTVTLVSVFRDATDITASLVGLTIPSFATGAYTVNFSASNGVLPVATQALTGSFTASGGAADYIITTDAEWDTVFANSAATLSGKIAEVRGVLTKRTVQLKAFTTPFTLRGGIGGEIPAMLIDRVSNLVLDSVKLQHRAWPGTDTLVSFGTSGASSDVTFKNVTFRHGYGVSNVDFDTSYDYPEFTRTDNLGTATSVSSRIALSWRDTAPTTGTVFLFNNGTSNIYVAFGDATVVAVVGVGAPIAPGAYLRIDPVIPATSHVAVVSATGSHGVNARTEVGMTKYLQSCFTVGGGAAKCINLKLLGCEFNGVSNAIKAGAIFDGECVIMDCFGEAIYQDIYATGDPATSNSTTYFLRNRFQRPFARSGIAQNLNGDAGDPHGDLNQRFGTQNPTYQFISAGNSIWTGSMRSSVGGQGHFWQIQTDRAVVVSDIHNVGQTNGALMQNVTNTFVYGLTEVDTQNPSDAGNASIFFGTGVGDVSDSLIAKAVGRNVSVGSRAMSSETYALPSDPSTVFSGWANRFTAKTRAEIEAAFTTVGAAADMGGIATRGSIDWSTTDHTSVIKWDTIPAGFKFDPLDNQDLSTVVSTPIKRILNRKPSQAVVPAAGTQWRSVNVDGTTQVQAWTSGNGTIAPFQYIQIRGSTSAVQNTSVTLSIAINGFTETVDVKTKTLGSSYFVGQKSLTYDGAVGVQVISLTGLTNGLATAPAAGDLVVVSLAVSSTTTKIASMSVNTAGYTQVAEIFYNATIDPNLGVYYKVMDSTPDTTVSVNISNGSTDAKALTIQVFRGFSAATPLDVTSTTASGAGVSANPPAITPTTSGAVIVVAAMVTTGNGTVGESDLLVAPYLLDQTSINKVHASQPRGVSSVIGNLPWTSGAYDPAAMSCAATASGNGWIAVTMALRPI